MRREIMKVDQKSWCKRKEAFFWAWWYKTLIPALREQKQAGL